MRTPQQLWRAMAAAARRAARGDGPPGRRLQVVCAGRSVALAGRSLAVGPGDSDALVGRRLAALAGLVAASAAWGSGGADAQSEAAPDQEAPVGGAAGAAEQEGGRPRGGRRHLLKKRSKMQEKREEVDLMKAHLDEYRQARAATDSLRARFQAYASQSVAAGDKREPAMTFTDFVHSFTLPRFHTRSPNPEIQYQCDFVGNGDGLITFEECYLLLHLLQIPKENFAVAFCMFDLDGDGAVDKAEFCHVIENLLHVISAKEGRAELAISAEDTLPRLTKHLFGHFTKQITAQELGGALDQLRRQILRAEFDLYARRNPGMKNQVSISVHDFAITLVSCFDPEKLAPYLERVHALRASDEMVSWDDFFKFHFCVQSHLKDIKLAFELTGADEITEAEFIRAARVVSGVELSLPVVKLAFRIFDSNDNGTLDRSELFKVLEMRNVVDLRRPPSASAVGRLWRCVTEPDAASA